MTLLEATLAASPPDDPERAWAFLVFCGVIDTAAHAEFCRLGARGDLTPFATRRGSAADPDGALGRKLWSYFEVGRTLEREHLGVVATDEVSAVAWVPSGRNCVDVTD